MTETAFVIGNGESRKIFGNLEILPDNGTVYGCNAIYRDWAKICDRIVAVNADMFDEIKQNIHTKETKPHLELIGPDDVSKWDYINPSDQPGDLPEGLKIYRTWQGGDMKRQSYSTRDFTKSIGSGCSAVLHAAESGYKNICILAFDILGARQWAQTDGLQSRIQNNMYKETDNYPKRMNMKAYLKYEWLFHLTQTMRRFPDTNFYFFNRKEYLQGNYMLPKYFAYAPGNVRAGTYADLMRWCSNDRDKIEWQRF